ncbi:LysE family transporter [Scleromatobacter humisilvae]|uniref:LysE family transporter n=1 Tax=Scleromatobacter humisilvae TaxID=2897159 RepID=A0A9X1YNM3_9BURK|nr:LysE family transporter [Scleromatobacter humisilvae]MCK9687712.1 LysE family transporter [Scleromatobacter humisilvae]
MTLTTWITFFLACWAISLSPGPGAVAAMTAGLNHGFRRGYFMVLGLVLGIWTQVVIVAAGLGAVIAASNTVFTVLKFCGAAYLVWIGVSQWRASDKPMVAESRDAPVLSRGQLILRGWAINATNPKAAVFMLAVVTNFIDPARPLLPQYVVIALSLSFTDLVVMAGYVALASRVLRALNEPHHVRIMNRCFGGMFVVAGTLLATFRRSA